MLLNQSVIDATNLFLDGQGIEVLPLSDEPDTFLVIGDGDPQAVTLPRWDVQPWQRGFGGWLCTSGRSVRFVRHRLSHLDLYAACAWLLEKAEERNEDNSRTDVRSKAIQDQLCSRLPWDGFYVQDFDTQLAECLALSILGLGTGRTNAHRRRAQSQVRAAVSKFMNSFPISMSYMDLEDTSKAKFLQFQLVLGYPREGIPVGTEGFFRDHFAHYLSEVTRETEEAHSGAPMASQGGLRNAWDYGPFTASLTCTSKGDPGEWVTLIPPLVERDTPRGRILTRIHTPLMMASQVATGYNIKRTYREGNAWKNSCVFAHPRPLTHCLHNGLEHNRGESLAERQTELVLLVGRVKGVNLYDDPENPGEGLDLDDILVTPGSWHDGQPVGHEALKIKYRERWDMTAESWEERHLDFVDDTGGLPPGWDMDPHLARAASVKGQDIFTLAPSVYGPEEPDPDTVAKVLVNASHKAMFKRVTTLLMGIDCRGNRYPIDIIVSGSSIRSKKLPYIPLEAVAGRADVGKAEFGVPYWEDFENPIHPERIEFIGAEETAYIEWACRYDDLVKATTIALLDQGENPTGKVTIYGFEPDLSTDDPDKDYYDWDSLTPEELSRWTYRGDGLVGYCRASRLMENERSSSRSQDKEAVPSQPFLNFLADRRVPLDPQIRDEFNTAARSFRALPSGQAGDPETSYREEDDDCLMVA